MLSAGSNLQPHTGMLSVAKSLIFHAKLVVHNSVNKCLLPFFRQIIYINDRWIKI